MKYTKFTLWVLLVLIISRTIYLQKEKEQYLQTSFATSYMTFGYIGEDVFNLQKKLKELNFYKGSVDGKYSKETFDSLKDFQKVNGLNETGIVDQFTLDMLNLELTKQSDSNSNLVKPNAKINLYEDQVWLLASIINIEGRGKPYITQVSIGSVILNRVNSSLFPNTISDVIYQPFEFNQVKDGHIYLTPNSTSLKAARDAFNGFDPTDGCLYYSRTNGDGLTIGSFVFSK